MVKPVPSQWPSRGDSNPGFCNNSCCADTATTKRARTAAPTCTILMCSGLFRRKIEISSLCLNFLDPVSKLPSVVSLSELMYWLVSDVFLPLHILLLCVCACRETQTAIYNKQPAVMPAERIICQLLNELLSSWFYCMTYIAIWEL